MTALGQLLAIGLSREAATVYALQQFPVGAVRDQRRGLVQLFAQYFGNTRKVEIAIQNAAVIISVRLDVSTRTAEAEASFLVGLFDRCKQLFFGDRHNLRIAREAVA